MSNPTVVKTWSFSVNNRITPFVSLNATMSQVLYGIKNFLVATMGYTVKYTCDGTTGPSSSSDHTDRWASAANCVTRGAAAGNAQSFCVLTDGNGVDIMITYQGATDDIARISFSDGALFLPAGTANQQPTATDESVILTGVTWINATSSQDRVWHIAASSDKKIFRFWLYRQSALISSFGVEQVTSVVTAIPWTRPVVGWNHVAVGQTNLTSQGGCVGTGGSLGTQNSATARVSGNNLVLFGGGEMFNGGTADPFGVVAPELQAAGPVVSLAWGSATTNFQGKLADRIDVWGPYVHGFAQGDVVGANAYVFFGTVLHPWNGASLPAIT